ncbi:MAG TPA: hypothetical protein VIN02_08455 [Sulfurovum sp.]
MIYKLIITTVLLSTTAYTSVEKILSVETKASVNQQTELTVWQPTIAVKKSRKSCDDGNCITRSNCFTKDGKAYELFSSARDKIKDKCKKIF